MPGRWSFVSKGYSRPDVYLHICNPTRSSPSLQPPERQGTKCEDPGGDTRSALYIMLGAGPRDYKSKAPQSEERADNHPYSIRKEAFNEIDTPTDTHMKTAVPFRGTQVCDQFCVVILRMAK